MIKSQLIKMLSLKEDILETKAEAVVNTIFKEFAYALKNGRRVEIRGFGNFIIRDYMGYPGRNPKTGKEIQVAPKKLPYFKVGKELKDRVNFKE